MTGEVKINRAGLMMTVQDRGRPGLLRFGVSASGPMDGDAFAIANALVGNADDAAVLEFALIGGALTASRACLIAITGGMADIRIDGRSVPGWESHVLRAGEILTVGALRGAVWGYIALSGGIATPPVLGSRATHLRTGIGGLEGRALLNGDCLPLGPEPGGKTIGLGLPFHRKPGPIRIIPGPQDDYFDAAIWRTFLSERFIVATMRDRMAMMLDGPHITAFRGHDIVSDGTLAGSVQVPSSGRPIVLMADRQTTGGYPKIATVASADLMRLAQTPSGSSIRFQAVSREHAEDAWIVESKYLAAVIATLALAGCERSRA